MHVNAHTNVHTHRHAHTLKHAYAHTNMHMYIYTYKSTHMCSGTDTHSTQNTAKIQMLLPKNGTNCPREAKSILVNTSSPRAAFDPGIWRPTGC